MPGVSPTALASLIDRSGGPGVTPLGALAVAVWPITSGAGGEINPGIYVVGPKAETRSSSFAIVVH